MFEGNRERYAADLAYEHDLSLPQGRQLASLAIHSLEPTFAPEALRHLSDAAVAEAFVSAPLGPYADATSVDRLDHLAQRAVATGFETAGAWLARARVAEHRGALGEQRAHLEAALALDPGFGPALFDLGFLAFVEGDVKRSERLLTASRDARADRMLHALAHQRPQRSPVGRNQPCPCGSGHKRKHCCATAVEPLPERAMWLWDKAATWLHRLPQHRALLDVACSLTGADDLDDDADGRITAVLMVPVIESIALLDGGLLPRFLEGMGAALLPDDERGLAASWTEVCHRAWRVEATTPGRSLVLADLDGDRTVEALNGSVSRCTQPGELLFAAVVPTSDGWFLPCHPTGMSPAAAGAVADLVRARIEPLAVAATVFRHYDATM